MRPGSFYSRKQRSTYEDLSDDDSKLLQDSLKILIYKLNLEKKKTKKNHKRRSSNALLVARCWWIELPFNSSLSQGGMDLLLIPHFQSLNNVQLGSSEIRGNLVYRQTAKLG